MKKQDIDFIKNELKNDCVLNDFIAIVKTNEHTLKICYKDKVITLFDMSGFAYLISWYCEGCMLSSEGKHISQLCDKYNDRF